MENYDVSQLGKNINEVANKLNQDGFDRVPHLLVHRGFFPQQRQCPISKYRQQRRGDGKERAPHGFSPVAGRDCPSSSRTGGGGRM